MAQMLAVFARKRSTQHDACGKRGCNDFGTGDKGLAACENRRQQALLTAKFWLSYVEILQDNILRFDQSLSSLRTAMKASVGTCTVPRFRIFFLPSFCFSSSFFLRVISPP